MPWNAKHERYFVGPSDVEGITKYAVAVDGLAQDWSNEICWCNPPYGNQIEKWIVKAATEAKKGALVVMLLPARVETRWFSKHIRNHDDVSVVYLPGRLTFSGMKDVAPFGSIIAIFWPNIDLVRLGRRKEAKVADT